MRHINTTSWYRLVLAACVLSSAQATASNETRSHAAHEHGVGQLNLAVDGNELIIELEVPSINVVGFEHAPETAAQRQQVEQAITTFQRVDQLFVPSAAADCEAEHVAVSLFDEEHEQTSGDDGHEHEAAEHEGEERHADLRAEYHFHCERPDRLVSVETRLFDHLRDAHELAVQAVTETNQLAVEITPGASTVLLSD